MDRCKYGAKRGEMKVYLVGGAVRDQLMGYPVRERDWVVVGGTREALLQQGYQQVGREFPVFIHPKTGEEYALARTERKQDVGYYGFQCDFNPHVRLEEDLARRDLTINAIAMDEQGQLIDPFHGQAAIAAKRLEHVSDAFIEDPVRILRVARFMARFYHAGFHIAQNTMMLMRAMVQSAEVGHLIPERVWQELDKSLGEPNPEQFILVLRQCGALKVVIPEIDALFGIPAPHASSPLIDSGLQALDALQKATAVSDSKIVRFAALMHGIGHLCTAMADWPKHQAQKAAIANKLDACCQRLRVPKDYQHVARLTALWWQTIQQLPLLSAEQIVSTLQQCDAFRRPLIFATLLITCDAIATTPFAKSAQSWQRILAHCQQVTAASLVAAGFKGRDIQQGLYQKRVDAVRQLLEQDHEKK